MHHGRPLPVATGLLKLPSQANVLSTRHLFLYSSSHLLRRPLRFLRGGMQGITPLRRSQPRKRSQSYALSATSLSGLFLGRPLLRGTRTRSKVSWASFTSARLAREMESARGIPFPSTTSIRFVPLPTSINPVSSPFLPKKSFPSSSRLEGNACRMRVHTPSSYHLFNLRHANYIPRTSAASPSTHNRCAVHTGSRSSGHRPGDGRFGRAEAKAVGSFLTAHPSAHSFAPAYLKISQEQTGFE